jgi:hypothetical protein
MSATSLDTRRKGPISLLTETMFLDLPPRAH